MDEAISEKVDGMTRECPKCNSEMKMKNKEDIIEILSKLSDEVGTKLELISADSVEGDMLLKAFSGVAGILRYRINNYD
jgi:peptide chain release factor subunit 1